MHSFFLSRVSHKGEFYLERFLMRYLSDPGPQDTLHGADLYHIWDGACPIPIYHVTIRINLGLVGIEGNHPSSTRDRLLGSYRSRVSM